MLLGFSLQCLVYVCSFSYLWHVIKIPSTNRIVKQPNVISVSSFYVRPGFSLALAKTSDKHKEIEQLAWVSLFRIILSAIASLCSYISWGRLAFTVLCYTKVLGLEFPAWACVIKTPCATLKPTCCLLTTVRMFTSYVILLEQLCRNRSHLTTPWQSFRSGFIFLLFLQRILFSKCESD